MVGGLQRIIFRKVEGRRKKHIEISIERRSTGVIPLLHLRGRVEKHVVHYKTLFLTENLICFSFTSSSIIIIFMFNKLQSIHLFSQILQVLYLHSVESIVFSNYLQIFVLQMNNAIDFARSNKREQIPFYIFITAFIYPSFYIIKFYCLIAFAYWSYLFLFQLA